MAGINENRRVFTWGHSRRFNAYSEYFRTIFGERVQKVSIDAGFTCPNRDGSKGTGGCTFCNNKAFNPSYCTSDKPVSRQIMEGIEFHKKRYRKVSKYLAYFQAYSNTYASPEILENLYREALDYPGMAGLIIGTRPDCITSEILDLLQQLSAGCYLAVEYGVESCYNDTLLRINRGHTFEEAVAALEATASRGINTGAHFIFGLPGESREDMMNEAVIISGLPLTTVKFHQLQIIRGTQMEKEYHADPGAFELFSWDEYCEFFISFLERFNPQIVVERLSGEAPPDLIARQMWGKKRSDQVTGLIEKRLEELDTWQGRLYKPEK